MIDVVDCARTVLHDHASHALCHTCLAAEMGVPFDAARQAAGRLRTAGEAAVVVGECSLCLRQRMVIHPTPALRDVGTALRVVIFLAQRRGLTYCMSCLAFDTCVSLDEARAAIEQADGLAAVQRRAGRCATCGRETTVVAVPLAPSPSGVGAADED